MKSTRILSLALSAVLLPLLGAPAALAKDIKPSKEWTGLVENAKLEKEWPNASPITNKDDFAKVWKSWAGDKEVPEVDFDKNLVLVSTQTKGQISGLTLIQPFGNKEGDFVSTGSIDPKPIKGFAYAFTVFKRDGIKTINGKPLK